MKKIFLSLIFCAVVFLNLGANDFVIDAEKNAYHHNNLGINWMKEKYYYGAIKEFEMAIKLNPNTQATAVYYNNLGRAYLAIGHPALAQKCFERAMIQNPISFDYYTNLVATYKQQKILDSKLKEYKAKKSDPLNAILVGLIYIEKGEVSTGITMLDNFCHNEPDIIISKAVRNYLKDKSYKKNSL